MNTTKRLTIEQSPSLVNRFSSIKTCSKKRGSVSVFVLYGRALSRFEQAQVRQLAEFGCTFIDGWYVGQEAVCLMQGELTPALFAFCDKHKLDLALKPESPTLFTPGVALFDMDSTLIQIECIDEIAKRVGLGDKIAHITERAMQGELDFEQSLRERVAILKGTDVRVLDDILAAIPYMSGAHSLMATLSHWGWKTALASGGFTWFSDRVSQTLGLDFARSNQLELRDGKLTGNLVGEIIDAKKKAGILVDLADFYHCPLSNTVAVGDGANDLAMMEKAGLGIAYHAKPKVEQKADVAIRHSNLLGVLCVLSATFRDKG
jgi:phosphoserine phosphatase